MRRSPQHSIDFDQIERSSIGYTIIRPTSTHVYYIPDSFDRPWQATDRDTINNLLTKDHTQLRPWLRHLGRGVADPSLVKGTKAAYAQSPLQPILSPSVDSELNNGHRSMLEHGLHADIYAESRWQFN